MHSDKRGRVAQAEAGDQRLQPPVYRHLQGLERQVPERAVGHHHQFVERLREIGRRALQQHLQRCFADCFQLASLISLTDSSWLAWNWPISRSIVCICLTNAGVEPIGHDVIVRCSTGIRTAAGWWRRRPGWRASRAAISGRRRRSAAVERRRSAGSRRRAISRSIASCWRLTAPARSTPAVCSLLPPGLRPPAAFWPASCGPFAPPAKAGRRPGNRVIVLAVRGRRLRQVFRRGLENPPQRFQPAAQLERAEEPPAADPLGDFHGRLRFVPVDGRLEPVLQRVRMRDGQHRQRFHRVGGPIGGQRIAQHLVEEIHGHPRRAAPPAYNWSARPM